MVNTRAETSHGSSFVYEYRTDKQVYPFLVTTRQLVRDAAQGRIDLMQADGNDGPAHQPFALDIDRFTSLWRAHPQESRYNIVVTPFVPFVKHVENGGTPVYFSSIGTVFDVSDDAVPALGDDAYALGFSDRAWDCANQLPVLLKGAIASSLNQDYGGDRVFVFDRASTLGMLGAPVVVNQGGAIKLLGMLQDTVGDMSLVLHSEVIVETIEAYLRERGFL